MFCRLATFLEIVFNTEGQQHKETMLCARLDIGVKNWDEDLAYIVMDFSLSRLGISQWSDVQKHHSLCLINFLITITKPIDILFCSCFLTN